MSPFRPADPLRAAVSRWSGRPALDTPGGVLTFAGLDRAVDRVAARMVRHGIGPRDPVLLRLDDDGLLAAAVLAAWRIGAVAVPVSTRLPGAVLDRLAAVLPGSAAVGLGAGAIDPESLRSDLEGAGRAARSVPQAGARRRATILFTSGSSGEPRAVVHRLAAHLASADAAVRHVAYGPGDRWLATLSMAHVGGLAPLVRSLVAGATLVTRTGRSLDVAALRSSRATHVSVVSTQLRRLIDEDTPPPPTLRCVLAGGGPLEPGLVAEAVARGWPLVTSYGMTETGSLIAAAHPVVTGGLATSGKPLPHAAVRIGPRGEILIRSAALMEGYLVEGRILRARDGSGWFHSGDRGYRDGDGRLVVEGRIDRQFVSGGENVQPEAIERLLRAQPGVREAVVVPVADREFGSRPFAFVEPCGEADAARYRAALREVLPGFMIPVAFRPFPGPDVATDAKPSFDRLTAAAERERPE